MNDITAPRRRAARAAGLALALGAALSACHDPHSYTLGGSVSGLDAGGLVLSNGTAAIDIPAHANSFLFPGYVFPGTKYAVSIVASPKTLDCSLANATGIMGNADVSSIQVNCIPAALHLNNGQAAALVIGQPDFTTGAPGTTRTTQGGPTGVAVAPDGTLYIAELGNNRVTGFTSLPAAPGAPASFVLGQADFTSNAAGSTANKFASPYWLAVADGHLLVDDYANNRVLIYNALPGAGNPPADVAIGASTTATAGGGSCAANQNQQPVGFAVGNGKLVVADLYRVVGYGAIPTHSGASADLVLGQPDFTTCTAPATPAARSLSRAVGVWTDGTRLLVTDYGASRVLVWNRFPTANDQPPDLVLGQADFVSGQANRGGGPTSASLALPYGVWSNGNQIIVSDLINNRVLVWNNWPTANGQSADVVLGQPDFTTNSAGTSATKIGQPTQVAVFDNQLLVADFTNNRVLVWKGN